MDELVSILIPAYNAEQWIHHTIKSALNQTWPNKEIIIVDDGSTDNTLKIAKTFESRAVKVAGQANRGASAARNKALSFAQGEYIQWLDADDILAPDKISRQMKRAESGKDSRILLSSSWGRFFHSSQKVKFSQNSLWQDLVPAEWLFYKLNNNEWMCIESWLVSRALTDSAGPWDEELSMDDDGEYFSRIVAASERITFVAEAESYCRAGNISSISSEIDLSDQKKASQFKSICLQIKYLRSLEDSARTREACLRYLQRWLFCFYPDKHEMLDKAYRIAKDLGGELHPPTLKWQYSMIQRIFGWKAAKQAQASMRKAKMLAMKNWYRFTNRLSVSGPSQSH